MKVLFVFYVPSGGVETLNRQRRAALELEGISSHFLYYGKRRELVNDHGAPLYITNEDAEIKEIFDANNFDAAVVTSDFLSFPRFRRLGFKGKLILEVQGFGPKELAYSQLQMAVPIVNNYANALLHPKTEHIAEIYEQFYPHTPTFAFDNCFDSDGFSYIDGTSAEKPIIAWIGRIEDNKNWREFLQIGRKLLSELRPDLRLYMFHDPSLADPNENIAFEQMLDDLQLRNHVSILPDVPHTDMPYYFSMVGDSGGFLLATSKVEGAGYAVLEAISCGCPVLTTDSDGVRRAVIHNQTGKYYQIGDPESALKEAKELMTNTEQRAYIRENARIHVKERFGYAAYAGSFKQMLLTLGLQDTNKG
ncbi:glycosyltransferase family 4 protein [Terribacillus saccharophilus]|uniref:Glycosyl transferase family 1 n=1 Tax=Terribacillus saccharophilus TaxID=361277 RepID=A0ABX4GXL0_9BACI|nr:glycosyltransferase family 4 protein [Terribacillus saccharophilus]PAD35291.1 glycosyl transferase family 1 [Terribacillus saccharophilus]PAD96047.1 glycosyl transferase family 1 [Terribacillus saccharophilus]PAD99617.1 glycosyl transferase family 1 [Terribacillus saccharophilus]